MESKYNLLTRLLKNIKNVVNPDGSIAGSGEVLVVHETETNAVLNSVSQSGESGEAATGGQTTTLDKTWQQIHDADVAFIVLDYNDGEYIGSNRNLVIDAYTNGTEYGVAISANTFFTTSDPNGFPQRTVQG